MEMLADLLVQVLDVDLPLAVSHLVQVFRSRLICRLRLLFGGQVILVELAQVVLQLVENGFDVRGFAGSVLSVDLVKVPAQLLVQGTEVDRYLV